MRANKRRFNNWDLLIVALKKQFLPCDYEDRLWEEIRKRTQGASESVGIYFAVMSNLFERLVVPVPENKNCGAEKKFVTYHSTTNRNYTC